MTISRSLFAFTFISAVVGANPISGPDAGPYGFCGGQGWTGATNCVTGFACQAGQAQYHQCVPVPTSTGTASGADVSAPTQTPTKDVGKLPALGWNSWNAYGCDINEDKILAAANYFKTLGLDKAGYVYVNIDDCWLLKERDSTTGRLVPDPDKFPDGINGTADKVHALGLKIGIYNDAGSETCAGYPGSLGHEDLDAQTWSEWNIDYLKYDNCNVPSNWTDASSYDDWYNSNSAIRYRYMTAALDSVPNPIEFSLCIWGSAEVWTWGSRVGHSWRMTGDITADWGSVSSIIASNAQYLDSVDFYSHNDMDMMEIGNGNLTAQEQRSHFAIWAALKSPILLGNDLSKLSSDQLAIITNAELLAFSQDETVGAPAKPFTPFDGAPKTTPPEYYAGKSSKGTHVFILNTGNSTATKTFSFANVDGLGDASGSYTVHDMWTGSDIGVFSGNYTVSVESHDTVAYFVSPA